MSNIWKIDTKYNIYKDYLINTQDQYDNICICSYCIAYLSDKNKLKTIIKPVSVSTDFKTKPSNTCESIYTKPMPYLKCYICERFIQDIINGPNVLKIISDHFNCNNCSTDLLMTLGKVSVWYYHHPYDYFGHSLKTKFKIDRSYMKNIYQAIKELKALPNFDIIDQRATDLYKYVRFGIGGIKHNNHLTNTTHTNQIININHINQIDQINQINQIDETSGISGISGISSINAPI
jgi:hypothetical protein